MTEADTYRIGLGDEDGAELSVEIDFTREYEVAIREDAMHEAVHLTLDQWKRANDFIALILKPVEAE